MSNIRKLKEKFTPGFSFNAASADEVTKLPALPKKPKTAPAPRVLTGVEQVKFRHALKPRCWFEQDEDGRTSFEDNVDIADLAEILRRVYLGELPEMPLDREELAPPQRDLPADVEEAIALETTKAREALSHAEVPYVVTNAAQLLHYVERARGAVRAYEIVAQHYLETAEQRLIAYRIYREVGFRPMRGYLPPVFEPSTFYAVQLQLIAAAKRIASYLEREQLSIQEQ